MGKAHGPKYNVPFRRRRENVTDYRARVNLLKSKTPRLVVRKSNRYILAQVYQFSSKGDLVIAQSHAKELKQFNWLPKNNTPTAYLVGLLLAKKLKNSKNELKRVVLDIGRFTSSWNSNLFAVAKAFRDYGIECPMNEQQISEDRIRGEHISKYASTLDEKEFKKRFGEYLKNNIDVKKLPELFEEVKRKILSTV